VLVGVGGLLGLMAPASAWAGTYTWTLPTAQAPGASNPDHDGYGATPWSYVETRTVSNNPGASQLVVSPLADFSTTIQGGLTGWYDSTDADVPFVAANRNSAGVGVVPSGALALQGSRSWYVAVGWTSPLSVSQKVSVIGMFNVDDQDPACLSRPDWVLIKQDGTPLASSPMTGARSQSISAAPTLDPGQTMYLVVGWAGASYSRSCVTAGLGLSIQAPSSTPVVSLDHPIPGTHISAGQPTFSGHAASDFGDAATVTVRVYKGTSSSGPPAQRLSAPVSDGAYSTPAAPPLANGTYTAVVEQDDQAGDAGYSSPVTFSVHNVAPQLVLKAPGHGPVRSHTPQLSGAAGTRPGDASAVYVGIWKGRATGGDPLRYLWAIRGTDGRFTVRVTPALANGTYTAVAAQAGAGAVTGVSQPLSFQIEVPPVPVIGSAVIVYPGSASLTVGCPAISGSCTGDVLVLTTSQFTPVPGGPRGPVRVLFAHVSVPAGFTQVVRRGLPGYLIGLLRRRGSLRVRVSAQLTDAAGHSVRSSAIRPLRWTARRASADNRHQ
jgi:hypothetical protein